MTDYIPTAFPPFLRERFAVLLAPRRWPAYVLAALAMLGPSVMFSTSFAGIDYRTFLFASIAFWQSRSPYFYAQLPGTDQFLYSPLFAFIFRPVLFSTPLPWNLLNALIFWSGLFRWVPTDKLSPVAWIALLAALCEVHTVVAFQQVNGILLGLVLLGLAEYRDEHDTSAALLIAAASFIKVVPVVFALPLLLTGRPRFRVQFLLSLVVFFLAPALVVGWANDLALHREWLSLLHHRGSETGLLDIGTSLQQLGFQFDPWKVRLIVGGTSLASIAAAVRFRLPPQLWISVGLIAMMLANPRAGVHNFIFVAPVYFFLETYTDSWRPRARRVGRIVLLGLMAALTFRFHGLWDPRFSIAERPENYARVVVLAGLWLALSGELLLQALKRSGLSNHAWGSWLGTSLRSDKAI